MNRLVSATLAITLAMAGPASAHYGDAYLCADLLAAKRQNDIRKTRLITDYPGTWATLIGCWVAVADVPEQDRAGALLLVCGGACAMIGMNYCIELGYDFVQVMSREDSILKQGRANGCRIPN